MDTLIVGGIVVLALIVLVVALVMWLASPVDGETVTMTVDEALGRVVASEQVDPHGHIEARQFWYNDDAREWQHIPCTGEPEPGPISLVDQRIADGRGLTTPGSRDWDADLAGIAAKMDGRK
jgi:hypothetical protein